MNQPESINTNIEKVSEKFPLLSKLVESLNKAPKIFIKWGQGEARLYDNSNQESLIKLNLDSEKSQIELVSAIGKATKSNIFSLRPECFLSIPSKGMSFRKIDFPQVPDGDIRDMVALKLEQELPLSLSEFAWGYYRMGDSNSPDDTTSVVAMLIRKSASGNSWPQFQSQDVRFLFIPAIVEASRQLVTKSSRYNIVNIEKDFTEILHVEDRIPRSVKHFAVSSSSWHSEDSDAIRDLIEFLGSHESIIIKGDNGVNLDWKSLSQWTGNHFTETNFINPAEAKGELISIPELLNTERTLSRGECVWMEGDEATSSSLNQVYQKGELKKWVGVSVGLVIALLLVRYIEPFYKSGIVDLELKSLQEQVKWIPEIDKEVSFLQMMDNNLVPFEGIIPIISSAVDSQFQLTEIILSRRGDLNITATVKNADQISKVRKKLMETEFFKSIVVESQTPDAKKKNISLKLRGSLSSPEIVKSAYQKLIKENTKADKS